MSFESISFYIQVYDIRALFQNIFRCFHSLTQSVRGELKAQEILVVGVYPGPIDTDMAAGIEMEKEAPQNVAQKILNAIESGQEDCYPDPISQVFARQWQTDAKELEREWSSMLPQPAGV